MTQHQANNKAKTTPRRPRNRPVPSPFAAQKTSPPSTPPDAPAQYLTPEELTEFRELLLAKRTELVGDLNAISHEALSSSQTDHGGNLSSMPIHMADIGSDNWEQEFNLSLLETEQHLIREIDSALNRIEQGTYGLCEATRKRISKKRLRAQPWARHCIEHARQTEQGKKP